MIFLMPRKHDHLYGNLKCLGLLGIQNKQQNQIESSTGMTNQTFSASGIIQCASQLLVAVCRVLRQLTFKKKKALEFQSIVKHPTALGHCGLSECSSCQGIQKAKRDRMGLYQLLVSCCDKVADKKQIGWRKGFFWLYTSSIYGLACECRGGRNLRQLATLCLQSRSRQ